MLRPFARGLSSKPKHKDLFRLSLLPFYHERFYLKRFMLILMQQSEGINFQMHVGTSPCVPQR